MPDERVLLRGKVNVVVATTTLAFRVKVRNLDGLQQRTTVSFRISRAPMTIGPVVKQLAIGKFGSQMTKTVTFTHLGNMAFATNEKIVITVASASGQRLSATYPVIFALG